MDNRKTWDRLSVTNPDFTKKIGGGPLGAAGFSDINPMWRWMRLTEEFGPCGAGWQEPGAPGVWGEAHSVRQVI